jgi:diguanylate cyclase (GGDEF)-like protein
MAKEIIKSLTSGIKEMTEILDDLTTTQNLERTIHKVVKNLYDGLGCQTCAVIRISPKTEKLEILNSNGLSWQFCKDFRQRAINPLLNEMIWKGMPVLIRDVNENPGLVNELRMENDFKSCYCVILMANLRPQGYLYVDSNIEDYFSDMFQLIVQLYARIVSLAFLKENLLRDLQKHAEKDEHTGAFDYSIFYNRLQEAISRAQRLEESLSLVIIDVVKFDQLLTSHGDEICTELMNEIMITINKHIRKYDSLSKFGTDEVIVSLPGNSSEEALGCVDKLYKVITESSFTREKLKIDLSIGLATYPDNAKTFSGLLTAVKHALVECKRNAAVKILKANTFFN